MDAMQCHRAWAATMILLLGAGLATCEPGTISDPCPAGSWIDERCIPRDCADRACPADFVCVDGACVEVACWDVECPPEQVCAGGQCYPRDCETRTCPGVGEVCVDQECQPAACVGVECPPGEVCAQGRCYPQDCQTHDCPGYGTVCIAEQCQDRSCVGVECPPDQACASGYCYPSDCEQTGCFGDGEVCIDGRCVRRSCVGVECPPGERCADGYCLPADCADVNCSPAGEVCQDGVCVPADCVDVECEGRERCARGQCFDTVCGLTECAADEVCIETAAGWNCTHVLCVGVECPPGERCADGRCLPSDCDHLRCGVDEVCLDGRCVPEGCAFVECPQGEVCGADRECYPLDCADVACGDFELCVDGQCIDRLCVGIECPAGERCAGGRCYPLDCAQPCGPDQVCIDGRCTDAACAGCRCCPEAPCTLNAQCETVDCCGQRLTCLFDAEAGLPVWSEGGDRCSDLDPCTLSDRCRQGVCSGEPIECFDPPADTCEGQTRVSYPLEGVCNAGECTYPAHREECEIACQDGVCTGEPCGDITCDAGELCVDGACSCGGTGPDCDSPQVCCGEVCVSVNVDPDNCGFCGNVCGPHSSCHGGTCHCDFPYGNCNGDWADGCEVDTLVDLLHCGGCGQPCPAGVHADRNCVNGVCRYACDSGWDDCDADPATCETDVQSDDANCGGCGLRCGARARCIDGDCVCDQGWGDCNRSQTDGCETDLDESAYHCGGCDQPCLDDAHSTAQCVNGTCQRSCQPPMQDCDDDPGTCESNADTDPDHCGDCDTQCGGQHAVPVCNDGQCGVDGCQDGWCDLDGQAANGCEHDLDTDPNCGEYMSLGAVSGDEGSDQITEIARGEHVYRVHVQETYTSMVNTRDLSAMVRLTPPAGCDYDLEIYCDNCASAADSSSNAGSAQEEVYVRWDEGSIAGLPDGGDDDRYIYLRVTLASCALCDEYTLEVFGHQDLGGENCDTP